MISFQTRQHPCNDCKLPSGCIVWQCPACQVIRWIDDWEGYDAVTVCPDCCAVVKYEEVVSLKTLRLCRLEVLSAVEKEPATKQRERRLFA